MAFFNSDDSKHKSTQESANATTIITLGASLSGEITLECNLFVDGKIEGTIRSSKNVTVGHNGAIEGEVYAQHLVVQGNVRGNVEAEIVEIKESGRVSGTVESREFIIEPKGFFEGQSILKKEDTPNDTMLDID